MGRRYYCDYCEKSFIDDVDARKKHLNSTHHIKLRQLYYEQHRDPKKMLAEESLKSPCRRFMQNGECQFAGNCKYTHFTPQDLWNLEQQIQLYDYEIHKSRAAPDIPSLDSWLEAYNKQHNKPVKIEDDLALSWTYPDHLECRSDLPVSLRRFRPEDFVNSDFEEWGL